MNPSRASATALFLVVAALGLSGAECKRQDSVDPGLGFVPLNEEEESKLLGGESGYGYIAEESGTYCVELPGGKNSRRHQKLRLDECDQSNKRRQVWKVERYDSDAGEFKGSLRSGADDDKCLEVKRKNQDGARLRVGRCKKHRKSNQQWTSDGSSLKLVEIRELCAYHKGNHPKRLANKSIVLRECDSIPSDYAEG
mmetsp:Transcript_48826/g.147121  ORF Transcript_48826/g.147121 Transcript_48826/m.147121 type:complete len:197 (-) Transcript_48826:159-749(-)